MSYLAKPYLRLFIRKFEIETLLHPQLNLSTMLNSHRMNEIGKKIYSLPYRVALDTKSAINKEIMNSKVKR